MRSPEFFPNPLVFQPERWLADEGSGSETAEEKEMRAATTMRRAFVSSALGHQESEHCSISMLLLDVT